MTAETTLPLERYLLRTEPLRALAGSPMPIDWVVVGDSVVAGSKHTVGHRNYTELLTERARHEMRRSLDTVVNTAVAGWSATEVGAHLDRLVLRYRPDVVFIGLGFNDAIRGVDGVERFRREYGELVDRLAEAGVTPVVQVPNATLPTVMPPVHEVLPRYREALLELAADRELPVIDHYGVWAGLGVARFHGWIGHGCHPNAAGHRMLARLILAALGWDDPDSLTVQLAVPGAPRIVAPGRWVSSEAWPGDGD